MNNDPIKQRRKISQFFYENILFDYVSKELSTEDHDLMKELTSKGVDNKKHLGSILLALEYLNKIESVELKEIPEKAESTFFNFLLKQKYKFLFLILTSVFIASGYYVVQIFK